MLRFVVLLSFICAIITGCDNNLDKVSDKDRVKIKQLITKEINEGIEATRTKNIDLYMSQMPDDLIIYDESGEIISKQKQKEYALRDWAIIDTTLNISIKIDSILYLKKDSVVVYTYQKWKRMMFQRNGIKIDTVLTTQKHKEIWKNNSKGWFGYQITELGGEVFVNGKLYNPN